MAGIKQPIQDILAKLATIQVTNQMGVTAPLYSRVWNDQVKREKRGEAQAYPRPAAFLEIIHSPQFAELGFGFASADVGWKIHLVHEFMDAEDGTMDQDLTIFDLRDQVVAALSLYYPTACGPLVKVSEGQDYDHDNIYEYIIDFVCNFIDSKGSPYDPATGKYIDTTPPTGLAVNFTEDTSMPDNPGTPPESNQTTFQPNLQFKIPKQ